MNINFEDPQLNQGSLNTGWSVSNTMRKVKYLNSLRGRRRSYRKRGDSMTETDGKVRPFIRESTEQPTLPRFIVVVTGRRKEFIIYDRKGELGPSEALSKNDAIEIAQWLNKERR